MEEVSAMQDRRRVLKMLDRLEKLSIQIKELEPSFEWRWSLVFEGSGGWSEQLEPKKEE